MQDKFVYTGKDAAGCAIQSADYTQCKDCVYNNEDAPHTCLIYKKFKPSTVLYDGKPCSKKRTE